MARAAELYLLDRSARDRASLTLSDFEPEYHGADAESFLVTLQGESLHAELRVSGYLAPDLGQFFHELAAQWRGWEGERGWSSLEGEFELSATSDRTGHTTLQFKLRPPLTGCEWRVAGALLLEAGNLESVAQEVSRAWSRHAT